LGLDSAVRGAVKTAATVTKSLQETVQHFAWTGQVNLGEESLASAVSLKALVEQKLEWRRLGDGRLVEVQARLTFLEIVAPNGASGRIEPIDPKDKLVLVDGTTGPVYLVSGLRDPGKSRPYFLEVWLGAGG